MRKYEVLVYSSFNGMDAYRSLGVYDASSPKAAANKALRALADDPLDAEGCTVVSPDPAIIVLPLRAVVPVEGLRIPQEIIDAWEDEFTDVAYELRVRYDDVSEMPE